MILKAPTIQFETPPFFSKNHLLYIHTYTKVHQGKSHYTSPWHEPIARSRQTGYYVEMVVLPASYPEKSGHFPFLSVHNAIAGLQKQNPD